MRYAVDVCDKMGLFAARNLVFGFILLPRPGLGPRLK
jgi:hypothetical protein